MEEDELGSLLYTLHTTPVTDQLGISSIAKCTSEDPLMCKLLGIIKSENTWIPRTASKDLQKFRFIFEEITMTGNNIFLNSDRIILPEKLQKEAIRLAYRGSYADISLVNRCLRSHFFFHNMQSQVMEFVNVCTGCKTFVDKKTVEPLRFL